jgi:hypothetical protein
MVMATTDERSTFGHHGTRDELAARRPLWKRLAWLVGIWTASVLALGAASWLMRLFMNAAGLGTPP